MDDTGKSQSPLPPGYRQGVISAITVVIAFSLLFMRYWGFEVTGRVTITSVTAGMVLFVAIRPGVPRAMARPPARGRAGVRIQEDAALVHDFGQFPVCERRTGGACHHGDCAMTPPVAHQQHVIRKEGTLPCA